MPDGMPFMKQRGNPIANVERWLPKTRQGYFELLVAAHDPDTPVADALEAAFNPNGNHPEKVDVEKFCNHMRVDWFGYRWSEPTGSWVAQPPSPGQPHPADEAPDENKVWTTGHWIHWFGDAESIVRVAIIRTMERLLDLEPLDYSEAAPLETEAEVQAAYGLASPPTGSQCLPHLDIWWICPQPRFEAAVESDGSSVRLEFLTPAPVGGVLGSGYRGSDINPFLAGSPPGAATDMSDILDVVGDTKTAADPTEAWIIGSDRVTPYLAFELRPVGSPPFAILDPFTLFVSEGLPTTVDPTQPFGGRP